MHGINLALINIYYSPVEKIFIYSMLFILVFIVSHLIENIYRFFRIKKGLQTLKSHLDTRVSSSDPGTVFQDKHKVKKKKSPVLKFISDTFTAFDKLKPGMNHSGRYHGVMNHLTHESERLFLKRNLFIILGVLSIFFGGLSLIIGLCSTLGYINLSMGSMDNASVSRLGDLLIGVFGGIIQSLGLQILTLLALTLSGLTHVISRNIVKSISGEITKLEILFQELLDSCQKHLDGNSS